MDQAHDFSPHGARTAALGLRTALIAVLLALLAGAGAMLWLLRGAPDLPAASSLFALRDDEPARIAPAPEAMVAGSGARAPEAAVAGAALLPGRGDGAQAVVARVEQVAEHQGGIDARVAAMEQRLAQLDLRSQAAAGNAARAEALLIAFAARRAIERGAPLGYLADQLALRFGDASPNAVRSVIEAAQRPVTLDQLLARLDGLSPSVMRSPADESMAEWILREVSQLFVIRREDTPSPVAERRLLRARLYLESGRTEAAVAEIRNLPNAAAAKGWIADAERHARAQRALELLETTAVLEPRDLRSATGARVEQPSPLAP